LRHFKWRSKSSYRLPTEAEWAYVARKLGRQEPARYPWVGKYPPAQKVGNFADAGIADTLANTVPDYNDGYRGTAPVGSFPVQSGGFYDLGGNVAEWSHDYYAVYPGMAETQVTDPVGPASGDHHVVRDSSWRQGGIAELRLSYRDYSRGGRPDLGFRIARYASTR
jgi:formylglycine-generating enzyme required for sulfatase activity